MSGSASPAVESSTVLIVSNHITSSQQGTELSLCQTHYVNVVLQPHEAVGEISSDLRLEVLPASAADVVNSARTEGKADVGVGELQGSGAREDDEVSPAERLTILRFDWR